MSTRRPFVFASSVVLAVLATLTTFAAVGCAGADDGSAADPGTTEEASQDLSAAGFKYPFQNWDYDGAHKDNPVSILFVSTKPNLVSRVYDQIGAVGLTHSGGKMTLSGVGGSRPGVSSTDAWTSHSAGRKGAWGCWGGCAKGTDIHVRTYGPDGREGTQIYQGSFGLRPYYLVATVHFDVDENTAHEDFGYQDTARALLVHHMEAAKKWRVLDSVGVKNACHRRVDPKHLCEHDGEALVISIDG